MARRNDEDKEQKQYRAILEELLKQPENKFCADCNTAGIVPICDLEGIARTGGYRGMAALAPPRPRPPILPLCFLLCL